MKNIMAESQPIENNKSIEKHFWRLLIPVYLLLVMALALQERGTGVGRQGAFLLILALSVFLKPIDIFSLIVAIFPLAEIARLDSLPYTLLPFLSIVFLLKCIVVYHRVDIRAFAFFALFVAISFISELVYWHSFSSTIVFAVTWCIPLFACNILKDIRARLNLLMWCFVISALICAIGSFMFPNAADAISNYNGEYTNRLYGISSPWSFGNIMNISAAFVTVIYAMKREKTLLYFTATTIFVTFAALSGTFSVLLGTSIILLFWIVQLYKKNHSSILITAPIIFIVAYLALKQMLNIRGGISDNGRFEIWAHYVKLLFKDLYAFAFGFGGGTIGQISSREGILTAHNALLELWLEIGFLGLFFLISYIIILFKKYRVSMKSFITLPIWVYIFFTFTQGGATSYLTSILITLAISYYAREKTLQNNN